MTLAALSLSASTTTNAMYPIASQFYKGTKPNSHLALLTKWLFGLELWHQRLKVPGQEYKLKRSSSFEACIIGPSPLFVLEIIE
jgi:hypothetical protein